MLSREPYSYAVPRYLVITNLTQRTESHPLAIPNGTCMQTNEYEPLRTPQPVEKVAVDTVGGPSEPENKSKTLRQRRIPPLNRGQNRARKGFSTGCPLPRTRVNSPYLRLAKSICDMEVAWVVRTTMRPDSGTWSRR